MTYYLYYIGVAGAYLAGVPARHLTEAEVAALPYSEAELLTSGLYSTMAPVWETTVLVPPAPDAPEDPATAADPLTP